MSAVETQEVRAVAKWVRMSPRKARLVTQHIRGRSVPEARTVLAFTQRAAAREIEKVLRSAVANAEANHGLIGDKLVVAAAYVDEGPVMKRWRARARGRVARIKRPTCHITNNLVPGPDGAVAPPPPPPAPVPEPGAEAPEAVVEEVPETTAEEAPAGEAEPESEAEAEPTAQAEPEEKPKPEKKPKPRRTTRKKEEEADS
ncbi:MAG: 50S ribosomal protein L22 [Gaiellaceae bacterium]